MKPLILNTSDIIGGAARVAYRLHKGLKQFGIDSKMLVNQKQSDDIDVIAPTTKLGKSMALISPALDNLPLIYYRKRKPTIFSAGCLPDTVRNKVVLLNPDIIHLHWICKGFLRIETIGKFTKPIVWTLHDSWAFTGGCHLPFECMLYKKSCGMCPMLGSANEKDLSRYIWKRKMKVWNTLNLTVVTPSQWLAECARSSSLLKNIRIEIIPNGLDISRFKPVKRTVARDIMSLPRDKKLILFGAMWSTSDKNKGFPLLMSAMRMLAENGWGDRTEVLVFGATEPRETHEIPMKVNYMGHFQDEISLSLLYAASDVFVLPSLHENLPTTIMEAMACGTPCVAFDIGGIPDLIEHERTGYLARAFETDDLANGIAWILSDEKRHEELSRQARQKVEKEYDIDLIAKQYLDLYNDILKN